MTKSRPEVDKNNLPCGVCIFDRGFIVTLRRSPKSRTKRTMVFREGFTCEVDFIDKNKEGWLVSLTDPTDTEGEKMFGYLEAKVS